MRVFVTGTAGFIGFHLARRLLADGHQVTGVDGMTDYYDVGLKRARRDILRGHGAYADNEVMLEDADRLWMVAERAAPDAIVHLAAQAGVRYSLENPGAYVQSNLVGTFNVMEAARRLQVGQLLFASTSSVYGADGPAPFLESASADHPLSLYAASKKACEAMTHSYSHLWGIPTTVARFFTVYGPWGRPDMALGRFVEAILADRPIALFNHGDMERDFTYIDDLVEALVRLMAAVPEQGRPVGALDSLSDVASWRVVNIGRGQPVPLMDLVAAVERSLGRTAKVNLLPMQAGDSPATFASADLLHALTGYRPATSVAAGVAAYCAWYESYYGHG